MIAGSFDKIKWVWEDFKSGIRYKGRGRGGDFNILLFIA